MDLEQFEFSVATSLPSSPPPEKISRKSSSSVEKSTGKSSSSSEKSSRKSSSSLEKISRKSSSSSEKSSRKSSSSLEKSSPKSSSSSSSSLPSAQRREETSPGPPPHPRTSPPEEEENLEFIIKTIFFLGRPTPYLLQSANGPCPLLAVVNALFLRHALELPPGTPQDTIGFRAVVSLVTNYIIDLGEKLQEKTADTSQKDRIRQNVTDVIDILPTLRYGLNVNCYFTAPSAFEFTPELAVFDLLDLPLVHGWVISPEDARVYSIVQDLSYNQLMDKIVHYRELCSNITAMFVEMDKNENSEVQNTSEDRTTLERLRHQLGLTDTVDLDQIFACAAQHAADSFHSPSNSSTLAGGELQQILEEGAVLMPLLEESVGHRLTYEGLVQLHDRVAERQLVILFRGSHFSTLFKYKSRLYSLANDSAFADFPSVIWELLDQVDGDTTYCDVDFRPTPAASRQHNRSRAPPHGTTTPHPTAATVSGDGPPAQGRRGILRMFSSRRSENSSRRRGASSGCTIQ